MPQNSTQALRRQISVSATARRRFGVRLALRFPKLVALLARGVWWLTAWPRLRQVVIGHALRLTAARLEALSVAVMQHDWGAVFAYVADDCTMGLPGGVVLWRGREEITEYFELRLEDGERLRLERQEIEVAPAGDVVVVAAHVVGRKKSDPEEARPPFRPPIHLPVHEYFAYVIKLRGGKLSQSTDYPSHLAARAAAGLADEPRRRDLRREMVKVVADIAAFDTRTFFAQSASLYRKYEALVIAGSAFFVTVLWVLFCTLHLPHTKLQGVSVFVDAAAIAVGILALVAAVVLRASTWRLFCWLVLLLLYFLLAFASFYYSIGTKVNFKGVDPAGLSPLDAAYFSVGTVSTAGTGNIAATSQLARGLQLTQMLLGMALILVVVSAIVARLTSDGNRRTVADDTSAATPSSS